MHSTYTIKKYNGSDAPITNLEDVTGIDISTSLTFFGKEYKHYGKGFNQNFLHLLEHFNSTAISKPSNPMVGQMWYNNTSHLMMVYNGVFWDELKTIIPQSLSWSGSFTQVITGNNATFTGTVTATASECLFNSTIVASDYTITNLPAIFTPTVTIDTVTNSANITISGNMIKTTPSFNFNIAFKQSAFSNVYDIADLLNNPKSIPLNFASVTNNQPVGDVIILGTPNIDETLTATNNLTDIDGIGTIHYQWMRNGTDINNANTEHYTVASTDSGAIITVKAFYTDDLGFYNSKTSAGLTIIAPVIPSISLSFVIPFVEKVSNIGEFEGKIKIITTNCTINPLYDYATQSAIQFNNMIDTNNDPATIIPVVIVKDSASTSTELLLTITGTSDIHDNNLTGNILIDPLLLSATVDSSQLILSSPVSMRPVDADIIWDNTNMLQEELIANDGTMTGQLLVNLPTGFNFVATPSISMTPIAGLTPVISVNAAKTVGTITLTGKATIHAEDYTNITFTLLASDITTATLGAISPSTLSTTIDIGMTAPVYNVTWDDSNPFKENSTLNDGTITGQLKATLPTGFTFNSALITMSPTINGITATPTLNVANNEMTIELSGKATTHDTNYSDITFDLGISNTSNTIPGTLDVTTLSHKVNIEMTPPVYNVTWDDSNPLIEDISLNNGTIVGGVKAILPTGFTFSNTNVTMTPTIAGITVSPTLNAANTEMTIALSGQATSADTTFTGITFTLNASDTTHIIPGTLDSATLSHTVNITMYPTTTTTAAPTTTTTTEVTTTTTASAAAPVQLATYTGIKFGVTWQGSVDLDSVIAAFDASGNCVAMKTVTHSDNITGVVYGGDITTGGQEEYYDIDLSTVPYDKLVLGIMEYTDNSFNSVTGLSTRIVDLSNNTNIAQFNLGTITKTASNTANTTCVIGVFSKSGNNWNFTSYQKLINSHNGKHAIYNGDTYASLGL
jgi:stress response protein SCP2